MSCEHGAWGTGNRGNGLRGTELLFDILTGAEAPVVDQGAAVEPE